jgi:hypothetical protein
MVLLVYCLTSGFVRSQVDVSMVDQSSPGNLVRQSANIAVGVVGPDDLVERVLTLQSEMGDGLNCRLVAVPYRDETETVEKLRSTSGHVDAYLFTGPVPYDIAVSAGVVDVPATYVSLSGAALYAALLRSGAGLLDKPGMVSIDTLAPNEVEEAYEELDMPVDSMTLYPHVPGHVVADIVNFHVAAVRSRKAGVVFTAWRSAYEELRRREINAVRVVPTKQAMRAALRTAALLAAGAQLQASQVAIGLVRVDSPAPSTAAKSRYLYETESHLRLQLLLLRAVRDLDALVFPIENNLFLVVGTMGSFEQASASFQECPFYDLIHRELHIEVSVGIGLAGTVLSAEQNARQALQACADTGGGHGRLIEPDGGVVVLPGRDLGGKVATAVPVSGRAHEYLARLAEAEGHGEAITVVSADQVAETLRMTRRSARRVLDVLVEANLAWPLPPERSANRGRPQHRWRLLLERLSDDAS